MCGNNRESSLWSLPHDGEGTPLLPELGIASTSFMGAMLGRRSAPETRLIGGPGTAEAEVLKSVMGLPPLPRRSQSGGDDTLEFLERCHALGASGIQAQITGDAKRLRARAEQLGMWIEAMISIRNSTPEQLEHAIITAKQAGCTVARDGLLAGRRYETFNTLAAWQTWVDESQERLKVAVPIFEKHRFTLAIENHKDWTLDEYVGLFETYSSEYFGACLDFGNNLALLDGLQETIAAVAPYVKATHLKDLAVAPEHDGFCMSEVPLGKGILDLPTTIGLVEKANPKVRFSLEMITRDPQKIPCLTDPYWITFPERNGIHLARTLRYVNEHRFSELLRPEALPEAEHSKLEEENIRECVLYAHQTTKLQDAKA